ncbi:hypothetical protein TNCV_2800911 [Trichonephila clavipes]|nr:hypothetical protein TNCV_2800911 [Trichonephila clavipes]
MCLECTVGHVTPCVAGYRHDGTIHSRVNSTAYYLENRIECRSIMACIGIPLMCPRKIRTNQFVFEYTAPHGYQPLVFFNASRLIQCPEMDVNIIVRSVNDTTYLISTG